jgi:hypothetical protein
VDVWADLGDDELRARLSARLSDAGFVDWLVWQRENEDVIPHLAAVLAD